MTYKSNLKDVAHNKLPRQNWIMRLLTSEYMLEITKLKNN